MSYYLSNELRQKIIETDKQFCCYCQTSQINSGMPLSFDHIKPQSAGGETSFENVCLSCRTCNEFKSNRAEVVDPLTGATVFLFHPRRQRWSDHFVWSADGVHIEGLTPVGRATVTALRMNNPIITAARERWVISGWHPPSD
ncbi:MAG: HNH endonuclease [Cyanobacteria bacterium J06639_14]